ncbi:MAG: peptide chain release factor 1 [Bacillota bacterium]
MTSYEEQLHPLRQRYRELNRLISDPEIIAQRGTWRKHMKEHARIRNILDTHDQLQAAIEDLAGAEELVKSSGEDEDIGWLTEEMAGLRDQIESLEEELRHLLLPPDDRDEKDVFLEIRAGAGGGEASLFAADLYRMYCRYAERKGWKTEPVSISDTDLGGLREVILSVSGEQVFSDLKYESGVHRVQRVPATESSGRIHTSTATVAVMPEAEEVDLEIDPQDLQIDTYTSSGPGGQHVNKTESAVRITHRPTGIVVTCQDEKSQHRNRTQAMKVLRARILDQLERERQQELSQERRSQVGSGDRSERIRTYNFPQNRVTDHRINRTLHQLDSILDGELDPLVEVLRAEEEERRLLEVGRGGG